MEMNKLLPETWSEAEAQDTSSSIFKMPFWVICMLLYIFWIFSSIILVFSFMLCSSGSLYEFQWSCTVVVWPFTLWLEGHYTQAKARRNSGAPLQWYMLFSTFLVCLAQLLIFNVRLQNWGTLVFQLNEVLYCLFHHLCPWWLGKLLDCNNSLNSYTMACCILVVCICIMWLCNFMVYFMLKCVNTLAHAQLYSTNRY